MILAVGGRIGDNFYSWGVPHKYDSGAAEPVFDILDFEATLAWIHVSVSPHLLE